MITLATLKNATAQQVFDQAVHGLLKQGCPSIDEREDRCKYRVKLPNGDTLRCAAGMLIGDDEYTPEMDGVGGPSYVGTDWRELIEIGLVPKAHEVLIRDLQRIHDGEQIEDWERHFQMLANDYGLDYTWPNK